MSLICRWASASVLLIGLVGCGGSAAEIKPTNEVPKLDAAQEKQRDDQMEQMKAMQQKTTQGAPSGS